MVRTFSFPKSKWNMQQDGGSNNNLNSDQRTDKRCHKRRGDVTLSKSTLEELKTKGYNIINKIGCGSYGCVFQAYSERLKKDVALKIMETEKLGEDFMDKFLRRELETLKSLKRHPNIVEFYEVQQDEQYIYIVLEYCSHGDLFDYICKHVRVPESQSNTWFRQLIEGLNHCHEQGFAHRDLKCENLLLDENDNIKITDFGFACKLRTTLNETETGTETQKQSMSTNSIQVLSTTVCGSIFYASPELLKNQPYNPIKSDIWSCGVVLWIMIYGCYPFEEEHIKVALETNNFTYVHPQRETSSEFKELIKNIFTDEPNRYSIQQIKHSPWFNKTWSTEGEPKRSRSTLRQEFTLELTKGIRKGKEDSKKIHRAKNSE